MQKASFKNWQKGLMSVGFFGTLVGAVLYLGGVQGATQLAMTLNISNGPGGLDNGLVGHWTFDGKDMTTGQVNDRSGSGKNGSQKNTSTSTVYATGKIGQGLNLDGSDDFVSVATSNSDVFDLDTVLSISAWVKYSSASPLSNQVILRRGANSVSDENSQYKLQITTSNGALEWISGDGTTSETDSVGTLTPNVWHHVACAKSGGNTEICYIDGVAGAAVTESINAYAGTENSFFIGTGNSGANGRFMGPVDDVRIYNRAISADEAKQLYQMGK